MRWGIGSIFISVFGSRLTARVKVNRGNLKYLYLYAHATGVEFVVPRGRRYNKGDRQLKSKMRSSEYQRVAKLDLRREILFKYDVGEVFKDAGFSEDEARPYIANIVAKGSRISLKEAKNYTRSMQENEKLTIETCKDIISLLDKYKKYR